MPEATFAIKPWGNNLGVRLPAAVARAAHLRANQRACITVQDGRVIITPQQDPPMTLADRLAWFDAASHGGETTPHALSTARGAGRSVDERGPQRAGRLGAPTSARHVDRQQPAGWK